jgi:hypothetical protein
MLRALFCLPKAGIGRHHKKSRTLMGAAFRNKILAVSYSHMGRPHTTIGAERFHFRVRNGIGWFPLAIAARQTGWILRLANGGFRLPCSKVARP